MYMSPASVQIYTVHILMMHLLSDHSFWILIILANIYISITIGSELAVYTYKFGIKLYLSSLLVVRKTNECSCKCVCV